MSYIYTFNSNNQFDTTERCAINELLNDSNDEHCSIAQAIVEPGVTTQLHAVVDTIERYVILNGQGRVFIGDQPAMQVQAMDTVLIPANMPQKIQNCSDMPLIFLCICTPRFKQENYRNLEGRNLEGQNLEQPDT